MTTSETYTGWKRIEPDETRREIRIAARQMGDLVRSTLGPLGLDKMVVRRMQDGNLRTLVSNDGVSIVEEFEGETDHPIALQFVRLAEEQESEYGDGTTTVVLLGSELVATGTELAARGLSPMEIIEGISVGAQRTLERWDEESIPLSEPDGTPDRAALETIALSGMTNGRSHSWPLESIADVVVEAVLRVSDPGAQRVDLASADTVAIPGETVENSTLVDGALLPETVVTAERLLPVTGGALLIDGDLEPRSFDANVTIAAGNGGALDRPNDGEPFEVRGIASAIAATDAVLVVATGDVSAAITDALARRGIVCLRNVKDTHFETVLRVTGAAPRGPVAPGTEIDPATLGSASVRVRSVGPDDARLEITSAASGKTRAATIVVRGGTERTAGEAERRVRDGMNAVRAALLQPAALPAGGAAELEAAMAVRSLAPRFDDRTQIAIDAFADVLETIPRTLAANAGLDPIGALSTLRSRHDAGYSKAGLATDGTIVDDVTDDDALDPFRIKTTTLVRSVEFATSLLRIDGLLLDRRSPRGASSDGTNPDHGR